MINFITRALARKTSQHVLQRAEQKQNASLGLGKSLFNSKEHYLSFRKAWAAAVTSPRAKKTINHIRYPLKYYLHGKLVITEHNAAEVIRGWLNSSHMLLHNLLRDKPFYNGFTPISNTTKLVNSIYVNWELHMAAYNLDWRKKQAIESLKKDPTLDKEKPSYWGTTTIMDFLEPFNGTITREMLTELEIPSIQPIMINHGDGLKYMMRIQKGERPTYADIYGGKNEDN